MNWPLWTIPAAAGLYYFTGHARAELRAPLALAALLSVGAAVTASGELAFLILLSCALLLAYAMRLAAGEPVARAGAGFIATAPLVGALETVGESWRRTSEAATAVRSERSLPILRGLLIAGPVLLVLWLLLAQADPHMSAWGNAIEKFLEQLAFIPRLIFGIAIGVLVLGAYGLAMRGVAREATAVGGTLGISVGATERLIVLGSVTLLFALFVALQIPMFFGNPAAVAGSGVTYADWSRRGFAELATAATIVTVLIVLLDTLAARGSEAQERAARSAAFTLVALTAIVLATAFRRVALYEAAYGYTVARVRGQAFMSGVGIRAGPPRVGAWLPPRRAPPGAPRRRRRGAHARGARVLEHGCVHRSTQRGAIRDDGDARPLVPHQPALPRCDPRALRSARGASHHGRRFALRLHVSPLRSEG